MDAITPIVEALKHHNIHYLKEPQEVDLDNEFVLNAMVITGSPETWKKISKPNKINIALFHRFYIWCCNRYSDLFLNMGTIQQKYLMVLIMVYCRIFIRFKQQIKRENFHIVVLQFNKIIGEEDTKGFLIWSIEDKENFKVRHIQIKNPSPFITVELEPSRRAPQFVKYSK